VRYEAIDQSCGNSEPYGAIYATVPTLLPQAPAVRKTTFTVPTRDRASTPSISSHVSVRARVDHGPPSALRISLGQSAAMPFHPRYAEPGEPQHSTFGFKLTWYTIRIVSYPS
jgi:hypothetical protein